MDDSLEIIRRQMAETKMQIADKLELLKLQVSETVQSTGTAVNATVVTVQDAVQSVVNAFDVRRHIDRHPWLLVGGSVALGCLAVEVLGGSAKKSPTRQGTLPPPNLAVNGAVQKIREPAVESVASVASAASFDAGYKSSTWNQLSSAAIVALTGMMQDVASRAVPELLDYLNRSRSSASAEEAASSQTFRPPVHTKNHSESAQE